MQRVWIVAALALLLASCAGGRRSTDIDSEQIVTAFIGDLAATASASGKVLPQRSAALAVQAPGRVQAVMVQEGDAVQQGEVLLLLERDELLAAVESARQELALQEATLADLAAEPLPAELAAAELAVASAEARLQALQDGPRPQEIAAAEANLAAAQAGVWASSEQFEQAQAGAGEAEIARARAQVAGAQLALSRAQQANEANPVFETHQALLEAQEAADIAQAQLDALLAGPSAGSVGAAQAGVGASAAQRDARQAELDRLLAGASATQIAAAEATLAQAEAALDALLAGPTDEALRVAEAQVERARLALADAEAALEDAALRAPFDGVVSTVHVQVGEFAGGVALELLSMDSLEVALMVDETDIGALEVGQAATVTLETWPDESFDSQIVRIAPSAAAAESALVSYAVTLSLDEATREVRAGMTANASLLTAQRNDVLLLPSQAIIADRAAGRFYVDLVVGEGPAPAEGDAAPAGVSVERVEVTIGLRDDQNTQILEGLQAGDRVRVNSGAPRGLPFGPD